MQATQDGVATTADLAGVRARTPRLEGKGDFDSKERVEDTFAGDLPVYNAGELIRVGFAGYSPNSEIALYLYGPLTYEQYMTRDLAINYYGSAEGGTDTKGEGIIEYQVSDLMTKGCYVLTEGGDDSWLQFCVYR